MTTATFIVIQVSLSLLEQMLSLSMLPYRRYVVVTHPMGYHLAPEHQRVIGPLAEELINGKGLGQSYDRLPFAFTLQDGSIAYIYKKTTNFKTDDLKNISDTFVRLYPEHKGKFEIKSEMIRVLSGS